MSRAVRKQLFKTIDLLEKANKVLEKLLAHTAGREEEITGLLTDCQDGAISLGNSIEALYGEGTDSVKELEAYCENLYQLAISLGRGGKKKELLGTLKRQVRRLREVVDKDVPDKLEVVFLPYKASMWDSLESVWMAARDDEEAEAYVIPIPYYDKNPDGSFGEMHYEGGMYPEYVPVTGYNDYNFEMRQPDIIFIHNPYDECNYVTSVHPFFYSKNLKRFTGKLVYIPYFILNGKGIEKNYALLPGVMNSDYVIVQNYKEKEDYARYYREIRSEMDISKKLLPLGSPKFDKMCFLDRKGVDVPKQWVKKLENKTVILYNTSVNGLLNGNENYLRKIEQVFTVFQNSNDIVLLWRPHPLMEATLSSMRMELLERYQKLKCWFIEEEIGIYDDTPDMYMSFRISDGYYGDWSSLIWLYQRTGKPILIQNVEG